jgi:cation diffusion facilitator CzcD-associated flavoprotein CzcO
MLMDPKANRVVYDFWARKIRERITDPEKRDILAPLEPPHPFGGKRLSLEQDFYEQMNKAHVSIINIRQNPIDHVVREGIVTADGTLHKFDVIAIATGFDSFTGGLKDINPIGVAGAPLREKWKDGTYTAYGLTVSGFPNFFFLYAPQAPTAYANGPSITEPQGDWCVDVMRRMREAEKTRIDATREAELEWKKTINHLHSFTLRNEVDSWYMVCLVLLLLLPIRSMLSESCRVRTFPASQESLSTMLAEFRNTLRRYMVPSRMALKGLYLADHSTVP